MGEHQRLRDTRMVFQYATVQEFCRPVEDITGRTVRSFHSSIDTKVDGMAIETFVLSTPRARSSARRGWPAAADLVTAIRQRLDCPRG